VGTWKLVTRIAENGGVVTYVFGSDGWGTGRVDGPHTANDPYTAHFIWYSKGRSLYIGYISGSDSVSLAMHRAAAVPGGRYFLPGVYPLRFYEFRVFALTHDTLKMTHIDPSIYRVEDVPENRADTFRRTQ
jgi:hypothetical protein